MMIPAWAAPIAFVILLTAGVVAAAIWRKQPAKSPVPFRPADVDPAAALFANGNRPTEDEIAQARLGGTRGARELGAAPLVRQLAENTPPPVDLGHVA
jgi:hypothetical protein